MRFMMASLAARVAAAALALVAFAACKTSGDATPSGAPAPSASPSAPASGTPSPKTPVNSLPIPSASVMAAVNPSHLPAYDGPTGSIEGTVFVTGDAAPDVPDQDFSKCPGARAIYAKLFREGPPDANGRRPLADAVVGVTGYTGFFIPERNEAQEIALEGCGFAARTVALTFGQRLDIVNKTKFLFAPEFVQAPSPAALIPPPNELGDPVHLYPPSPGYFTLHDKVNELSYLHVDVYALLQPLHAVTDLSGHYRIDGVPVGKLAVSTRLPVFHDQQATENVEIRAGVVAKMDLVLHYQAKDAGAAPPPRGPKIK